MLKKKSYSEFLRYKGCKSPSTASLRAFEGSSFILAQQFVRELAIINWVNFVIIRHLNLQGSHSNHLEQSELAGIVRQLYLWRCLKDPSSNNSKWFVRMLAIANWIHYVVRRHGESLKKVGARKDCWNCPSTESLKALEGSSIHSHQVVCLQVGNLPLSILRCKKA